MFPAHFCWSLKFGSPQWQNITSPQPVNLLQTEFLDVPIGLKLVIELFSRTHEMIMCPCASLSIIFFFCIFILKQFERKHWVIFLILNIPLYLICGCSPSFIAWFLCTSHLQFLCQRVPQSTWLHTAEDRCCKHGVGTAAVTGRWICPEFMLCYTGCLPWDL